MIYIKNSELSKNSVELSLEEEWNIIEEFLKENNHSHQKKDSCNSVYEENKKQYQSIESMIFDKEKKRMPLFQNECENYTGNDSNINQDTIKKFDFSSPHTKACKRLRSLKQECRANLIKSGDVVIRNPETLKKCETVFNIIYRIYRKLEKIYNIKLTINDQIITIKTTKEAEDVFIHVEDTFNFFFNILNRKNLIVTNMIETMGTHLNMIAQDIANRISLYNFIDVEFNDLSNYRNREILYNIEFNDLIILLIYHVQRNKKQFEEIKSVLILALSARVQDLSMIREIILKTIILIKTGSIVESNDHLRIINIVIIKMMIRHLWRSSVPIVTEIVGFLKTQLQALKEEEQTIVPLKKDNLLFHLAFLKNKSRIFNNYIQPHLNHKNVPLRARRKISPSYKILTHSLDLLNNMADILFIKTKFINQ
ncbi:hypothetical protein NGRA_2288 [Nosema granulosis]|uniref:Uncharacterized protein n=1 Tax=Nosema granulosis TaxID=83296 RepID=A0A9P6GWY8_9MICR|nr:hypothetical protein NGRA_2288 [Nosema granulosis]